MKRTKPIFGQPPSPTGLWRISPFTAAMAPTAAARRSRSFSDPLFLGLLSRLPDPDGVGGVELHHPGYVRQLIELVPRDAMHLTIPRAASFEIFGCPPVVGVGLFDIDGQIEAYGVVRSIRTSRRRPDRFEFPSHQILIKRPAS